MSKDSKEKATVTVLDTEYKSLIQTNIKDSLSSFVPDIPGEVKRSIHISSYAHHWPKELIWHCTALSLGQMVQLIMIILSLTASTLWLMYPKWRTH